MIEENAFCPPPDEDLFAAAQARAEEGMEAAGTSAGDEWIEEARAFLREFLLTRREFVAEDLWEAGLEKPDNPRALGRVIREAAGEGIIERLRIGKYFAALPSPQSNMGPVYVWKSNLFTP